MKSDFFFFSAPIQCEEANKDLENGSAFLATLALINCTNPCCEYLPISNGHLKSVNFTWRSSCVFATVHGSFVGHVSEDILRKNSPQTAKTALISTKTSNEGGFSLVYGGKWTWLPPVDRAAIITARCRCTVTAFVLVVVPLLGTFWYNFASFGKFQLPAPLFSATKSMQRREKGSVCTAQRQTSVN